MPFSVRKVSTKGLHELNETWDRVRIWWSASIRTHNVRYPIINHLFSASIYDERGCCSSDGGQWVLEDFQAVLQNSQDLLGGFTDSKRKDGVSF